MQDRSRQNVFQLLKFSLIGSVGFAVDAGIMLILNPLLSLNPIEARPISFMFAVTITWYLNRQFTFPHRAHSTRLQEWLRYTSANGIGALLNLVIFYVSMATSTFFRSNPVFALAVASILALLFNFWASKTIAFRMHNDIGKKK